MRIKGKNIKIPVNTITVSYNDQGPEEAPVIIFIHGFPLNKSMWDMQMNELKAEYHVIAYDVRGFGKSDEGVDDITIDLFVKDLIGLMDVLEIDKATLCGLSMGGYIALRALEKYPLRFEALVLSDTSCIADTKQSQEKRMKTIADIRENGVINFTNEMINNLFAPTSFSTKSASVSLVKEMMIRTSEKSICNTLLALARRKETCSYLPEIKIPVLIFVGNEDKITPTPLAWMMHQKIENSMLYIVDHAGHLTNIENPAEFNEQLKIFINTYTQNQDFSAIISPITY